MDPRRDVLWGRRIVSRDGRRLCHRSPVSKPHDGGVGLSVHPTPRNVEPFVARTSWLKRCATRHRGRAHVGQTCVLCE